MVREPTPAESQLLDAQKFFESGDDNQALELVEATVSAQPDSVTILLQAAQVLGQGYEIRRAEELLERALDMPTGNIQTQVAKIFQQIFRPARAITIFEQLRAEGTLSLPSLAQLAKLYEQSNRQADAIQALQECVDKAPTQPQPKVLLARLLRQAGNLSAAANLLDTVVSAAAPAPTLVHAWSELTLVRDQQGDYVEAINAIERAKSLLREMPSVQEQARRSIAVSEAFRRLYSQVAWSDIQNWSGDRLDDTGTTGVAHLLGFPRSGTTLLEQVLDAHPLIRSAPERAVFTKAIFPFLCGGKQLSFEAIRGCSIVQLNRLRQRYIRCHEAIAGKSLSGVLHLDKNPNHTSLMIGLYRLFPESMFVLALRDPRDVIVSTYMRFFSLTEFSASYLTSEENTCALYAHEMNVWLKMRSLLPDNWIEVKYEEIVADLEAAASKVTGLLGVNFDEGMLNYRMHQQKFLNSPTHAEVRKPVYRSSVGRWRNYEPYLAPYLDRLEPFLKAFGYES